MSTDKTEEIRARLQGARTGPSDAAFVAHADEDIEYLLNRVEGLEARASDWQELRRKLTIALGAGGADNTISYERLNDLLDTITAKGEFAFELEKLMQKRGQDSDAANVWTDECPPGGFVCGECDMPTESEPCPEHQPQAHGEQ